MNKTRIFDKATKTELFLGQPVSIKYKDSFGNEVEVESNNLTLRLLSMLIEDDAVVLASAHPQEPEVCMNLNFYEIKVGAKLGLNPEQSLDFFDSIASYSPAAALSLVLKQIALELDKKYPDHIKESEKIFTVSTLNGKITEVPKGAIRNYRNFAAFRTLEDAKIACRISKSLLKAMFIDGCK